MILMTQAKGISKIKENIFENRFMHVPELKEWEQKSRYITMRHILKVPVL